MAVEEQWRFRGGLLRSSSGLPDAVGNSGGKATETSAAVLDAIGPATFASISLFLAIIVHVWL